MFMKEIQRMEKKDNLGVSQIEALV